LKTALKCSTLSRIRIFDRAEISICSPRKLTKSRPSSQFKYNKAAAAAKSQLKWCIYNKCHTAHVELGKPNANI